MCVLSLSPSIRSPFPPSCRLFPRFCSYRTSELTRTIDLQNSGATIPGVPQCQILGYGQVPPGHYGLSDDGFIARQDHRKMHKTPLSDDELEQGFTRMMQLRASVSSPLRPSHGPLPPLER